jgi:hypothetical protein
VETNQIISSGLLELYAAGLASEAEQAQVQQWIQQHPEVAAEFEAIQKSMEQYAQQNAVAPNAQVKQKVLAAIQTETFQADTARVVPLKNYWKWAAAAAIALLIGSTVLNISYRNKYNEADAALKKTQQELTAANNNIAQVQQDMEIVQSKYSMPVALKGTAEQPDAVAKIFWMQNTGDVFLDPSNLPAVPKGKQYQLWAIVDGVPVDAGVILIAPNGNKYRIQKMKSFGRAEAFAISLEEEGPALQAPKGKVQVVGKI